MAEVVDKFPGKGRVSQYAAFADGRIWKVTLGVDVSAKDRGSAVNCACMFAQAHGLRVTSHVNSSEPGVVYLQFLPKDKTNA